MTPAAASSRLLVHGRVELALHCLRERSGAPLLLLHELGGRAPESCPSELASWPGPLHALDFTGHGRSSRILGGGYTAEALVADADVALAALGCAAAVVGAGLGGYVALLLAGARPELVHGVLVLAGRGLAGGGAEPSGLGSLLAPLPDPERLPAGPAGAAPGGPDPWALIELERDVRPPAYVLALARAAAAGGVPLRCASELAAAAPPWLRALLDEGAIETSDPGPAIGHLAAAAAAERARA